MSAQALQNYHLHTSQDGSVAGTVWTNDDLDRGYPTEDATWKVKYPSVDAALSTSGAGISRVGISGVVVRVYLDGKEVVSR